MWKLYLIIFLITVLISWLWVRGIDNLIKYKKENPDHKDTGWLDWDCDNYHNEDLS